eukprot:scaffold16442_cov82-Phaeocystis_antarctica.AAC.1
MAEPHAHWKASLHATNKAGLRSVTRAALPFLYDPDAPDVATGRVAVCNDAGDTTAHQLSQHTLQLCFSHVVPSRSGLFGHDVDLQWDEPNGASTTVHRTLLPAAQGVLVNLSIPCGATVGVTTRAVSKAMVRAAPLATTVIIACDAPAQGSVTLHAPHTPQAADGVWCAALDTPIQAHWGFEWGLVAEYFIARPIVISPPTTPSSTLAQLRRQLDAGAEHRPSHPPTLPAVWPDGYASVGLQTTLPLTTEGLELAPVVHEVAVIASNPTQQRSAAAVAQFKVVKTPHGGVVSWKTFLNLGFLNNRSHISASWSIEQPYLHLTFEACVGTTPYGCQARPYENATLPWSDAVVALPCGVEYYLNIRATNCAGLQHAVASPGAKLCCSSPGGGVVSVLNADGEGATYATNETALSVRWAGFVEPCSGVLHYSVSLVDVAAGSTLFEVQVNATEELLSVPLPAAVVGVLAQSATYRTVVVATSNAGLTGVAEASFVVDNTPPVSVAVEVAWPGRGEQQLHANLSWAGCLPPSAGHVQLRWSGVADAESGVIENSLAVRGSPSAEGSLIWIAYGPALSVQLAASTVLYGSAIQFAVRSCNPTAQCSTSWSAAVTRVTAPSGGAVLLLPVEHVISGYINQPSQLRGAWAGFGAGSNLSALSYEACVGTTPLGCQAKTYSPASSPWSDDGL